MRGSAISKTSLPELNPNRDRNSDTLFSVAGSCFRASGPGLLENGDYGLLSLLTQVVLIVALMGPLLFHQSFSFRNPLLMEIVGFAGLAVFFLPLGSAIEQS